MAQTLPGDKSEEHTSPLLKPSRDDQQTSSPAAQQSCDAAPGTAVPPPFPGPTGTHEQRKGTGDPLHSLLITFSYWLVPALLAAAAAATVLYIQAGDAATGAAWDGDPLQLASGLLWDDVSSGRWRQRQAGVAGVEPTQGNNSAQGGTAKPPRPERPQGRGRGRGRGRGKRSRGATPHAVAGHELRNDESGSSPGKGVNHSSVEQGAVGAAAAAAPGAEAGDVKDERRTALAAVSLPRADGTLPRICGSRLSDSADVVAYRRRWTCLTSLEAATWVLDPAPRVLPWPTAREAQGFGPCRHRAGHLGLGSNRAVKLGRFSAGNWSVEESMKYVWQARSNAGCEGGPAPDLRTLDAWALCASLRRKGGSVFVVGDSLSGHFYQSLLNQFQSLGFPVKRLPETPACQSFRRAKKARGPACPRYSICGGHGDTPVELRLYGSLYLSTEEAQAKGVVEYPWLNDVIEANASVILLNQGAHHIPDDKFARFLGDALSKARRMLPEALVFFRSTAAGHPDCAMFKRPLQRPLDPEGSQAPWPFHWGEFWRQNLLGQQLVEGVGGVFLDVGPMTSLRGDGHIMGPKKDCLHYCPPGPIDDWVRVFAAMLQELA